MTPREMKENDMTAKNTELETSSSDYFLIEEYKTLRERYHSMRSEGIHRVNLLFTVTLAVLGGVLLFDSKNSSFSPGFFQLIFIIMLLILAVVGYEIFLFLIAREQASNQVERDMARIRLYFAERDKSIEDVLANTIHNNSATNFTRPRVSWMRSVQVIEAFLIALIVCVIANILQLPYDYLLSLGIMAFALTFTFLQITARRLLRKEMKVS
jgi:hypothetical protein